MDKSAQVIEDFSAWYNDIIYQAELADLSPVRGSIVIRPYGYAIWEHIKDALDERIKKTGYHNAAFPLLIPESFLKKEAEHVEGFAPELAVVTHAGGKELDEPLVIRPTSETIIHYMFAKWIKSWRDLPLKVNQWANIVRWEMRTRPFLRTTEIFWQEGHAAHATREEAHEHVLQTLGVYVDVAENYLAIPVITGIKSESEKFPGAQETHTYEGLMPDGKALQMGTSHLLSQSFAKSFDMTFQDQEGKQQHPYLTSFGATTRLVGATVMVHGDAKGLVLPPKVAPIQVVIVPITRKNKDNSAVLQKVDDIASRLKSVGVRVEVDADEAKSPGNKFYHWEQKGVPLRIEIGPRDLEQEQVMLASRLGAKEAVAIDQLETLIPQKLIEFQQELYDRAKERRDAMWFKVAKLTEFGPLLDLKPGFYQTGWCGKVECEQKLGEFKATTRCLLKEKTFEECFACEMPSNQDVLVAKAY